MNGNIKRVEHTVKTVGRVGGRFFYQIVQQFGNVNPFLQEQTELSATTRRKLLQILEDPVKKLQLQVELAAVIDAGKPFVKATYTLEGDLNCYKIVNDLFAGIHVQHYPNFLTVAQKISGGIPTCKQQWVDYGKACVTSRTSSQTQENCVKV